jgi:hypothetical protein
MGYHGPPLRLFADILLISIRISYINLRFLSILFWFFAEIINNKEYTWDNIRAKAGFVTSNWPNLAVLIMRISLLAKPNKDGYNTGCNRGVAQSG